jgi:hypothetical protein
MFDPYHKWFGIAKEEQPPTLYRLLGVNNDEQDREVIEEAAFKQTSHLRMYQLGPHAAECTRLLNEIAQARATLLDPVKRKVYDARLSETDRQAAPTRPKEAVETARVAVPAVAMPAPHHQAAARARLLVVVMATICLAGIALLLWMLFGKPVATEKIAKPDGGKAPNHLPFLAAVNDAELASQALRDVQGAQDAVGQAELGDGWWSLAQHPKFADLRDQLLNRARYWYVRALPSVPEGTRKLEIEDRAKLIVGDLELRPGLVAELFDGDHMERRRARRIDYTLNVNWGDKPPHPNVRADHFSIRWAGWLKAPQPGKVILRLFVDDGLRFVLDGNTLIDEYRPETSLANREIVVNLNRPYHRVQLDFVDGIAIARIHWSWRTHGDAKSGDAKDGAKDAGADEPVPADALFHDQHQREMLTCDYTPFQGSWALSYTNGVTREYVFDGLGNVVNWDKAKLHRRNGEWIFDAHDDRLERMRIVEGKLHVDHYLPASTYPGKATITAVGVRKQ